jgi:hypothetical protein
MLLVLSLSGVVAAATVLTAITAPVVDPTVPAVVADTTNTFEDVDGNGIDDDCQTDPVADPVAAASAEVAADLNGDGTLSVSEAAQSGWTGGTNCNHGGYVSNVARADAETETSDTTVPVVCPPAPVTTTPDATTTEPTVPAADAGPNAHGKAVSKVAHSTDVGGKNCNHGGAVSAAAHDTAARDAAKAARDAARAAKHLNKQHGKHHNG